MNSENKNKQNKNSGFVIIEPYSDTSKNRLHKIKIFN